MTAETPTVSIISPVYNAERFIERCIRSVLDQTFANWEMIIVDDGSTDRTAELIRQFPDPRIRYIGLPHRGLEALADSYNAALAAARGELIAVLEGDDAWPAGKLAQQVPVFEDPDVVLSWGRGIIVDENDRPSRHWPVPRQFRRDIAMRDLFKVLARWNIMSPALTVMTRRAALERIGGFQQAGSTLFVDLPTWLMIAATSEGKARYVDADLGIYRIHTTNTGTLHNSRMRLEHQQVFEDISTRLGSMHLAKLGWNSEDQRRTRASANFTRGTALFQEGDRAGAIAAYRSAMRETGSAREYGKSLLGYASGLTGIDFLGMVIRVRTRASAIAMRLISMFILAGGLAACDDPFIADSARSYESVATGGDHTCALTISGEAYCWGSGLDGELGTGTKEVRATPGAVAGGLTFTKITAGDNHSCAIATSGEAYCWGWNAFFQRGNSSDTRDSEPVLVNADVNFMDISAGAHHTCALGTDSLAYCWGHNKYGQVGNGNTSTTPNAQPVVGGIRFKQITAGAWHSCGVTARGFAHCWGRNDLGQLGSGSTLLFSTTPTAVAPGRFLKIDGGATHTCGVALDNDLFCWGSSAHGELGQGAAFKPGLAAASTPVRVATILPKGEDIAAGTNHTCASDLQGRPWCWGKGEFGQLAVGATRDQHFPQPVELMRRTIRFTEYGLGGARHACAILDRAVYCWGTGTSGQLGAEDATFAGLPQRVHD